MSNAPVTTKSDPRRELPESLDDVAEYRAEEDKLAALKARREELNGEVVSLEIELRGVSQSRNDIVQRAAQAMLAGVTDFSDPIDTLAARRDEFDIVTAAIQLQHPTLEASADAASKEVCLAQSSAYRAIVKRLAAALEQAREAAEEEVEFRRRLHRGRVDTSRWLDEVPFDSTGVIDEWFAHAKNTRHFDEGD